MMMACPEKCDITDRLEKLERAIGKFMGVLEAHMEREEKLMADNAAKTAYSLRELARMDNGSCTAEIKKVEATLDVVIERQGIMRRRINALAWVTGVAFAVSTLIHWAIEGRS